MTTKQHKLNSGFNADSTADEVLAGIDLTGRTALVTGGYSGLGLAATKALTRAGAHVIVPARRPAEATAALKHVPRTEVDALDLADLDSVRGFADRRIDDGRRLDIVINSAGVMACPESRVGPGWESQFAINHLGHFALIGRLRPVLASAARVVAVTSGAHGLTDIRWDDPHFNAGYDRWLAYGQSKTANVLFALHLDRLGRETGLRAFAAHPGSILTPLQRHFSREEKESLGWITSDGTAAAGFKTPEQGAATAVWAATSPLLEGHGGVYCEDCDIADPADEAADGGVKPWAIDPESAARLWELSAELTGVNG
ncbi:SDR family NAD(P)-dependent oxidoreductase [Glycomyces algeriensis]|uniref:Probable oxidoreductase n=1 Tax=Glycomyces algeriensis TaxID=256037 RepID=A0A9W6G9T5_9ACTN|nr:SDR family NAD(P)-dependent oxidoreductase [Glycomyces algeriensis]MDA1364263.1 SDR family NAD(P)-dependent oxidoreductase [Glycomyces algeriensis]MDR7350292.1 NAD(P)-dependent dehydrogenase (short-subunit alcohol dehydrogenase family) [Glycomyces algeriensis]GLI43000.1 oxidoreductase [Glycomyces algeriensis]